MQEIWERIETWLTRHAPTALQNLREGATDQDIQRLEAALGFTLPADLGASLR